MDDVNISVDLITETNLMKVTVVSGNPIKSFQVIDSIMNNYNELSEYLNSDAVIDTLKEPVVSERPNNALTPRKKSIQMGFVSAFVTALILAAISIMRKTMKTENAFEDRLGTTLLGTIYHENKNRTIKAKLLQKVKVLLVTSPIISTKFIESINSIRVKMEYEHERAPEKNVYMVTSVCENEGKSTVSLNLALSLARDGKRVIIIDADMRKPAVCKMLDIPKDNVVDFIKLLQGECGLDEVLYKEEKLGLEIIMSTKGHASTYEFVKSGAMRDLINKCSSMADYVIVDTPPMAMVSDAEALCDVVDFVSIVVRYDYSYEKDIVYSIDLVNDSNAKLLGCILNDYKTFGTQSNNQVFGYNQESERAVEVYDD
jgi:capsular exopolysaccharide synthesis family protein